MPTGPLRFAHKPAFLIVDDDPGIRGLIEAVLASQGYAVDQASSAAEARQLLRTRAYSLILSDYEMPGETGLDLLDHVQRVHPNLPFVILTGHDETFLARQAIATGALDFLTKPFEIRQLLRQIEQNLERVRRDRARAAQLTDAVLRGTIRALVAAIDAKDPYTATHSERTSEISLSLGRALDLDSDSLQILEFSALMHDVGKIGLPEQILLKTGSLDDEEWKLVRHHPIRSAEIVNQVGALSEVAEVVLAHHERMDGTGYPYGLEGEAIPFLSRVVAIADTYEALTSDRSYRRAMSFQQARNVIHRAIGSQFDPLVVEAFLSLDQLP